MSDQNKTMVEKRPLPQKTNLIKIDTQQPKTPPSKIIIQPQKTPGNMLTKSNTSINKSFDNIPIKSPGLVKSTDNVNPTPLKTSNNPIKMINPLKNSSNNVRTLPPSPNNVQPNPNQPQKMMIKKIPNNLLTKNLVKVKIKSKSDVIQRPPRTNTVFKSLVPLKIPMKTMDSPTLVKKEISSVQKVPIKTTVTKIESVKVEVTPIKMIETIQIQTISNPSTINIIGPPEAPPMPMPKVIDNTPVKKLFKARTKTILPPSIEEIKKEKLELHNQMLQERKKTMLLQEKQQQILEQLNKQDSSDLEIEKVCIDCGMSGEDAFCGNCGGKIEILKVNKKNKTENEVKVCLECKEEGKDAYCGNCGSMMVPKSDLPEPPSIDSQPIQSSTVEISSTTEKTITTNYQQETTTPTNSQEITILEQETTTLEETGELLEEMLEEVMAEGEGEGEEELGEIGEEDMNEFEELMEEIQDEQELELIEDLKNLSINKNKMNNNNNNSNNNLNQLSELHDVVIIELGSFYIKYGSSLDEEPLVRPSCNSYNTNTTSFQSDDYPIDSRNQNFALNNNSFDSLFSNILQVSELNEEKSLIVISSLPLQCRSNITILDKLVDSEYSNELPSSFYFGYAPTLSLIATSSTLHACGLAVEIGHRSTKIVPVYYGQCVDYAIQESILSGEEILMFLEKMISSRENYNSNNNKKRTKGVSSVLYNALRSICYVSNSFLSEMKKNGYAPATNLNTRSIVEGWVSTNPKAEQKIEIPDSNGNYLGVERFLAGEIFFQPKLYPPTSQSYPLHTLVYQAVASSPKELQQHLLSNIVLSGGVSKLPGLAGRLKSQLKAMVPQYDINVYIAPDNSAWLGAKFLSSSPKYEKYSMSQEEYSHIPFQHKFF